MARKRQATKTVTSQKIPTLAKIEADFIRGDLATAINAIQVHHNLQPSVDSLILFRKILEAYLQEAINRNDPGNFDRFWPLTDPLAVDSAEWPTTQATLLAKFGRLPQAFMQMPAEASESSRTLLIAHAADWAARHRTYQGLPEELHGGCKAVTLAFAKYERGDDDAARDLLNGIPLQSPFLDWKVLIRGLMAYAANDDTRALDNWQRLHPDRLPAKLIAPLRMTLDTAYRDQQTPSQRSKLQQQATALNATSLTKSLQNLRAVVGRMVPLEPAWRDAEAARAALKPTQPALAERLKRVLYFAVIHQGEPRDIERYRRVFGAPTDDPDFHRLNAMALESLDDAAQAIPFWERYDRWLSTQPAGWSEEFVAAARSRIMLHLGDLATALELAKDAPVDEFQQALEELLGRRKPKTKGPMPKVSVFYEQAALHDMKATEPLIRLMKVHQLKQDSAAAEAAAKRALERDPKQQNVLEAYAMLLQTQRRHREAMGLYQQAIAANPLDRRLQTQGALAVHATVRAAFVAEEFADADQLLVEHRSLGESGFPVAYHALRATASKKAKRADAAEHSDRATALPGGRLATFFYLSVDAGLAKLKPADKYACNKTLAEAMKSTAMPREIVFLYSAYSEYAIAGFDYRGAKSFDKKIDTLLEKSLDVEAPLADYEVLLLNLAQRQHWKLLDRAARHLCGRFPDTPSLMLFEAVALDRVQNRWGAARRVVSLLDKARPRLEGRTDAVAVYLLKAADDLARQYDGDDHSPFNFL